MTDVSKVLLTTGRDDGKSVAKTRRGEGSTILVVTGLSSTGKEEQNVERNRESNEKRERERESKKGKEFCTRIILESRLSSRGTFFHSTFLCEHYHSQRQSKMKRSDFERDIEHNKGAHSRQFEIKMYSR